MTLREKVAEVKPDHITSNFPGGVIGCPFDYSYLNIESEFYKDCVLGDYSRCEECWNREFVSDNVEHPQHYTSGNIECIDAMIETQGVEAVKNFCICNAFKYLWRHSKKNGVEDVKKAVWYLNKFLECEEK